MEHVIWDPPEKTAPAVADVPPHGRSPLPLRRVAIPKRHGGTRSRGLPTLRDRARQARHVRGREPIAEPPAAPNSDGWRPGRSAADAMGPCDGGRSHKTSAPGV
ncbi:MAG: hypothetical protein ACRERE_21520 [Candidatus Entotheonellia bacterium]